MSGGSKKRPSGKRGDIIRNYRNTVLAALLFTLAFAAVYSCVNDYEYEIYIDRTNTEKTTIDPREIQNDDELMEKMARDYFRLKSKNKHVAGWINVPNVCYYPIMLGKDNQFYLTHNEYDRYWSNGSIFMNTASGGNFDDMVLLHGHHLRSGRMFGCLEKFKNRNFFQNNDMALVFDGLNFYYYKQYTVFLMKDGNSLVKHMDDPEKRLSYFAGLYKKSMFPMSEGLSPDLTAPMLYLQTCDYTFHDARISVGMYRTRTVPYSGKYKKDKPATNEEEPLETINPG